MPKGVQPKLRMITHGVWTTAASGEAVRGETIRLEKQQVPPRTIPPIPGQTHFWVFSICGGDSDGVAYATRGEAFVSAVLHREGRIA